MTFNVIYNSLNLFVQTVIVHKKDSKAESLLHEEIFQGLQNHVHNL